MNFVGDYALLFAVLLPVATIAGLELILLIAGERGTGLLPRSGEYPTIERGKVVEVAVRQPVVAETPTTATAVAASNDEARDVAA